MIKVAKVTSPLYGFAKKRKKIEKMLTFVIIFNVLFQILPQSDNRPDSTGGNSLPLPDIMPN